MAFNPEEIGFWVKMTLIVVFGLWGVHIGGVIISTDFKAGKGYLGWPHLVAFLISLIIVVATVIMVVVGYRWPAGFDFVLVTAFALFVPTIIGLLIKAQEEKA